MTADVASTARRGWDSIALHAGAAGLAVLSVLEAGLEVIGHDDLWWNLATGRYIAEHLRVPTVDVFTYTHAGQPWANFEWLSNLLFFLVYEQLGANWIVGLRVGLIYLIFGVALAFCRMRSGSWLVSLLAVAYGAWVCRPFLDARPQLFTFLFSILLLLILDLYRRRGRNLLFLIPVILLVWTQLHGGYFFGLLLLGGNLAAEAGKRLLGLPAEPLEWKQIRTLAAVTLVSAAAVAINPWTFEAYVDPLRMSQLVGGSNIFLEVTGEWLRPEFLAAEWLTPFQFWPYLLLVGLVSLPIAAARWRSFDLNDTGLAAVLALAFALQHRRFIPLFTILTLPLLSYGVSFWIDWWLHGRRERGSWAPGSALPSTARRRRHRVELAAALAAWALLGALLPARLPALRGRYSSATGISATGAANTGSSDRSASDRGAADPDSGDTLFRTNIDYGYYPERAVRFLREAGISGRMFNFYNWGGYLEFTLPEQKTFIDGRAQMVFEPAFHERYLTARWGYPGWREVMAEFGVTWAILHTETNAVLVGAMLEDPGWTQVFGDETRAVFLKEGPENRVALDRFRRRELPLPETPRSHLLYARDARAQGDAGQALADLARARELAPDDERIRAAYVLALAAAGRPDEAGRQIDRALAERPDSVPLRAAQARLEAKAGRDAETIRILEALFARAPEAEEVIDALLEIDAEAGRRIIEQAYDREPAKPWASYAQGRLAEASGDLERARRFYAIEGRGAAAAGDSARMLRCQHALDRTGGRLK